MDVNLWRAQQRRLREAVRIRGRSADGRRPAVRAAESPAPASPSPPDLLGNPIDSQRRLGGQAVVEVKRLLRRMLAPHILAPQARFNEAVAETLAGQQTQLAALAAALERTTPSGPGEDAGFDYLAFEDRFRGSEQAIENRQAEYVEYFRNRGEVLDIGCGRGEFLALLREGGIPAQGVDTDERMVARCHEQGLAVTFADAFDFLAGEPDDAFGGVFASQVVEHLTTQQLVVLLRLIARKLTANGVLIMETLNPESLPVLMRWFWLDPTHVRLVHPETLQYFFDQAGFEVKTVQFRNLPGERDRLPALGPEQLAQPQLEAGNAALGAVNDHLFAPLDYFVVGVLRQ